MRRHPRIRHHAKVVIEYLFYLDNPDNHIENNIEIDVTNISVEGISFSSESSFIDLNQCFILHLNFLQQDTKLCVKVVRKLEGEGKHIYGGAFINFLDSEEQKLKQNIEEVSIKILGY